ncbi:hypothetical protein JD844_013646 [Phrynosoma platyrhinos]|uniref:Steroid 21-hydroxylase n=1 Tax=Phrynosoma platyrhinos TaxID=52577 RepID=A0ABQ7TL40_PHRPL|nr:hypothetical protein JD844_013646 [Phrynosoma platyrhinos]
MGGKDLSLGNYTPTWRLQRKLAHTAIQRSLRGDMEQIVQSQAQHLCKDMASVEEIHNCMTELVKTWSAVPIKLVDFLPILRIFPNAKLKHLLSCVEIRDSLIQDQIDKYQDSHHSAEAENMVDHMLQFLNDHNISKRGETGLFPEHVHMAIIDLLVGGIETTATLLTWTVAFLLHHPQIQEEIHKEIMVVVGPHREPTYSDRKHLPYLNAIIWETLRMRPSAPLALPHMTIHDTRFLEGNAMAEAQRHLVPFSCGTRVCLGEALARMEAFLFLTYVLRDFQILPSLSGSLPSLQPHWVKTE